MGVGLRQGVVPVDPSSRPDQQAQPDLNQQMQQGAEAEEETDPELDGLCVEVDDADKLKAEQTAMMLALLCSEDRWTALAHLSADQR